jgi:hypothetical protein
MKKISIVACISMLLISSFGIAHAGEPTQSCRGQFQATVTQGRDAGFTVTGELTFQIESSGEIEGVLATDGGSQVAVEGSVKGGKIRLTFELGDDAVIRGVGDVNNPFTCTGSGGGTLVGPGKGDSGDWGIVYGS